MSHFLWFSVYMHNSNLNSQQTKTRFCSCHIGQPVLSGETS